MAFNDFQDDLNTRYGSAEMPPVGQDDLMPYGQATMTQEGMDNAGMGQMGGDPFGYSNGSLLNPYGQSFNYTGPAAGGGGYSMRAYDPGKFDYKAYADPKQMEYGGYTQPNAINAYKEFNYDALPGMDKLQARPDFKFTGQDLQSDPSFAFRQQQGEKALKNMRSASGLLNTGATGKALMDYGQQAASQEYGNAFNRAFQTDQAMRGSDQNVYGINAQTQMAAQGQRFNQGAQANNMNFQNQLAQGTANEGMRLNAHNADFRNRLDTLSTNEAMRLAANQNQFGQSAAKYGYDKDIYDTQYQSEADQARSNAAAAASANNANYNRQLNEYMMNRGFYNEDQDRQFGKLLSLSQLGLGAVNGDVGQGGQAAGNVANLYGQIGNAQAAGKMGRANAWSNAMTGVGNAGDQALGAYGSFKGYW